MEKSKLLKAVIDVAIVILSFSAILDLMLWFTIHYHIPCWTIAALSIGAVLLLCAIKSFF